VKQTLVVKLAPSPDQHAALVATIERVNACCDWLGDVAYRERCANRIELQKLTYYEARERFGLSSQMVVRAIAKTVEAYKRDRTIRPRFRPHGAIPYDQRIMSWKGIEAVSLLTLSGRVAVPVRFGAYQAARIGRRRGQADLVYRDGVFFLYCTLEVPEPTPIEADDYLGIDLGIVNLAVDSDGIVYSGEPVERHRRIYAHRRRNLQRKGTRSAKRKLRLLRRKQARYQSDTNHVIAKRVVAVAKDTGRGIAIEDLGGIRDRTTVRRRQRARHANWAFFQLRSFVEYKAKASGVPVVAVDPRNTSRTCPECGHIAQENRPAQDCFRCVQCGLAGLPDAFAARVIAMRARAVVVQPMVALWEHGAQAAATSRLL
jgi:IS605 OrfB family transposase